jgi:mycothiol synthase
MNGPHIRHATLGDLPEVVDLLVACDVDEYGVPDTTAKDIANEWELPGFALPRDAWVAESADGLVGYAAAGDEKRTGELEGDLFVHPGGWDDGASLGDRLIGLVERRAAEIAAERGYDGARLDLFCPAVNRTKRELLERHGYVVRRRVFRMDADLSGDVPEVAPPEGIRITTFRAGTDDEVFRAAMDEAFEDHFRQSDEPKESWRHRLLGHPDFDESLWFVAREGDEVVGVSAAYDFGDTGWVKGLGVRRPWRRRGLAAALLSRTFVELKRRGQLRVGLGVDAEAEHDPLGVYQRAGMRVSQTHVLYEKPLPLPT